MPSVDQGVRTIGNPLKGIVTYFAGYCAITPEVIASAWAYLLGFTSAALIDNEVSRRIATACDGSEISVSRYDLIPTYHM